MYLRYFSLREHPFSITPDPAYLYLSRPHREALGHLLYGTGEHGGFVQLTGEVGTGKTTLIRALLEQEREVADVDVALCLNPQLTVTELLAAICDELGVSYPAGDAPTLKSLVDALNRHLLATHAAGRRTVVIIDEAQNLSREVLEQVRLLTNLETGKHKLLRIILVGQPELEELLARADLRQLAQRITARFHLQPLGPRETTEYIRHRIRVADGDADLFSASACGTVYRLSHGTPRLINTICERALMGAYANGKKQVTPAMVRLAASETLPRAPQADEQSLARQLTPVAVLLGAAGLAFGLHYLLLAPGILAGDGPLPPSQAAAAGESGPAEASPQTDQAQQTSEPDASSPDVTAGAADNGADAAGPAPGASSQADAADAPEYELPPEDASLSQLLRLWGVFGSQVITECRDALDLGDLRCLRDTGSFADLEKFNRPALLTLRRGQVSRQVLLTALDDSHATLVLPDGTRQWPRQALARLWTGEFQLVWRLQTSTRRIHEGSVGNSVSWLRRRLALARGENPDARAAPPSPIFDAELENRLRRFQRAQDLEVDGLVGARTMLALNNVELGAGTPTLNTEYGRISQPNAEQAIAVCPRERPLPSAPMQRLARLSFEPNQSQLSVDARQQLQELVTAQPATATYYLVGTSYNPTLEAEAIHRLALARARSAGQVLGELGVAAEQIQCVAFSGKRPPSPDMERSVLVSVPRTAPGPEGEG